MSVEPSSTRQENQFLPGKGKKLPGAFFLILRPYDSLMQNSSDLGHFKKRDFFNNLALVDHANIAILAINSDF